MFNSESRSRRFLMGEQKNAATDAPRLNAAAEEIEQIKRYVARNMGPTDTQWTLTGDFFAQVWQSAATPANSAVRYEMKRKVVTDSLASAAQLTVEEDKTVPEETRKFTATNLAEIEGNSHNLPIGTTVHCFEVFINHDPPAYHYYFYHFPRTTCLCKVTSNASGGGKYLGTVYNPNSTVVNAGNLALSEGATVNNEDSLIINARENGAATHAVPTATYHMGIIVGYDSTTATGPRWRVLIDYAVPGSCTLTSDTVTWVVDVNYTAATGVLDYVEQDFTFDWCNGTVTAGAQRTVIVATAEECDDQTVPVA